MTTLKAHDYPECYASLGINLSKLGCVMQPVETFDPGTPLPLYRSPHPERHWVDGAVSSRKAHVTLLYGLLTLGGGPDESMPARPWWDHVHCVMSGWALDGVTIKRVGFFPSPYPDEHYWCLVGKIFVTPRLLEGRQRLTMLPHLLTFPDYDPHVTIAYVDPVPEDQRDAMVDHLDAQLAGKFLRSTGPLDLGRQVGGR